MQQHGVNSRGTGVWPSAMRSNSIGLPLSGTQVGVFWRRPGILVADIGPTRRELVQAVQELLGAAAAHGHRSYDGHREFG